MLSCAALLSGCSSKRHISKGGGYYQDDGPGNNIPANIAAIPDAVPRLETPRPANARPYKVLGRHYTPLTSHQPYRKKGIASWYGRKFHGKQTASGETYDMYAMTAAHPTLPIPSYARVSRPGTGKSVVVRINDRGPFHQSRLIDLSYVAAAKLDLIGPGSGEVIVEAITNDAIRTHAWQTNHAPSARTQPIALATAPVDITPALLTQTEQVFLQFGAFSDPINAIQLAARLNRDLQGIEGHEAEIIQAAALHRVWIGPYANRTQAAHAAARIEAATGLKASYNLSSPARSRASL